MKTMILTTILTSLLTAQAAHATDKLQCDAIREEISRRSEQQVHEAGELGCSKTTFSNAIACAKVRQKLAKINDDYAAWAKACDRR